MGKVKFRNIAELLTESMETVQEFDSIEELKKHLNGKYGKFGDTVEDLRFCYLGMDSRINWDTHLVTIKLKSRTDFIAAGYTDNIFDEYDNIIANLQNKERNKICF